MDALKTGELLGKAVDDNDFAAFNEHYTSFLKQFPDFQKAHSKIPTMVPVTNAIFGERGFYLNQTTDPQAEQLLKDGREASKSFGKLSIEERLGFLKVLEAKIGEHAEDIMLTITADTGKPANLAKGEMTKGNEWFEYAAKEVKEQIGNKHSGKFMRSAKPLGAAQIIGAYNYPYALAIGGMVGALAAGNSVIVASPLKAPNWVFPFMQAAREAVQTFGEQSKAEGKPWADDFIQNASSLVQCSVGVNRGLTANADIVHFVGGDITGGKIMADRMGKRTVLEMGGSNVVTVMASAVESAQGAKSIADLIYSGFGPATGQRCTAPRMLCVQTGAEQVAEELKAICDAGPSPEEIGNPFKPGVKMGPLVDAGAHQKMQEAIKLAKELGASVHGQLEVGNNIVPQARSEGSFWVNPIVIDWTSVDMSQGDNAKRVHDCMKNEIFGPLLHIVQHVNNLDEAIAVTNKYDSHGLAGAIFTKSQDDVEHYQAETNITSLTINGIPKDWSPHGEHGHSPLSKIGGSEHFKLYTNPVVRADMSVGR